MEALLTDTLVSRQLYLRPPSQNPLLTFIQTLYFHISVSGRGHFQGLRFILFLCFLASVNRHPKGNPISLCINLILMFVTIILQCITYSYIHYRGIAYGNKTKNGYTVVYFCIPNVLLAGHAPESGHLSLTPPAAAYENVQLQLRTSCSRPVGVRLRELPLYSASSSNNSLLARW